jgi:opacity protein-like surface antigen
MTDHTSNARRRILRKLLLASAAGALAAMPALSAAAVDQPVIKSMTFTPQPVVAGAPAGTPIGTIDVLTSGATNPPEGQVLF